MMIALVIRGFVLVGVLGWYSASVWKMIDGYFKDKFDKYLQEEYIKNPHMKKSLQEGQISSTDKSINQLNENKIDPIIIKMVNDNKSESTIIPKVNVFLVNQSINNQSQQSTITNNKQSLTINNNLNENSILNEEKIEVKKTSEEYFDEKSSKLQSKKRTSNRKREKIVLTTPEPVKKKKKVKTITLSEEDFKSTRIKVIKDFDFSEFENDDDGDDDNEGSLSIVEGSIPVASLPYKPKADIGDLDRITEDEFCPISLDYNGEECGETKKWP